MSYKLVYNNKNYWVKETNKSVQLHYNTNQGCSKIIEFELGTDRDKICGWMKFDPSFNSK